MTNSDLNNKFPESIKVLEVFNHSEYEVPIYQRNYAWGKEEIEQLIKDIYESKFNSDNQSYYLGNLIVNRIETDTYVVIDGQQRLTTLFLLLSYLNLVTKNALRFEAREKSNRTLDAIRNIEDKSKEFPFDVLYSTEIVKGYSYIKNYFESGYKEEDSNLKNKDASEFKKEFIRDLRHDLNLFLYIRDLWKDVDKYPKNRKLIELLNGELKNKKVIIFTEFIDTADFLEGVIREEATKRVFKYTGNSNEEDHKTVIYNFDANIAEDKQDNDYDILITTDVLSHGVNLHRSCTF